MHSANWDARVDRALGKAPAPLRTMVEWLRVPSRRWLRLGAGSLLVLGGLLSILPVLGLWMLPLGLALIGEDHPFLKARLERTALWIERLWSKGRSWWNGSNRPNGPRRDRFDDDARA